MSYRATATMTKSDSLLGRIAACVATQGVLAADVWAQRARWAVCSAPGWPEQWDYGVAVGIDDPGADPNVITDANILASVAYVRGKFPDLEASL